MFTLTATSTTSVPGVRPAGAPVRRRTRCHTHPTASGWVDPLAGERAERSAAACRSDRRRVGAATYRRRRTVVGVVLAVIVALGIVGAHDVLAGPGGVPASAASGQPAPASVVTARPGDTLWSIAERYHGDVAVTRYVDALVDINGGASILAGQSVRLP